MRKFLPNINRSAVTAITLFLLLTGNVAKSQSTDATLKDLKVGGVTVTGFASTIMTYNVVLAYGTTIPPLVTVTLNSSHAIEFITQAASVTGSATVLVTAQDGVTTKTYTVLFSVLPFPSTDATLIDLLVDGITVAGFDKKTVAYTDFLPFGTQMVPVVTATLNEPHATSVITQASTVTGTATVKVTAQDGTTTKTYTITYVIRPASAVATLSDLKVGSTTVAGFASSIFKYSVPLSQGTIIVPLVSATVTEPNATTVITQATSLSDSAKIVVTAQDGISTKTYSVRFSVATGLKDIIEKQLTITIQNHTIFIELASVITQLAATNMEGKLMYYNTINSTEASINTDSWKAGIYLFQINAQNVSITKKLSIIK